MRIVLLAASVLVVSLLAQVARAQESTNRVSDAAKPAEAKTIIADMTAGMSVVDQLVEEARGERDALRLNCVNERKSQIAGLLKVAEISLEAMLAALNNGQEEAAEHEFGRISIAGSKVKGYATEAQQCIGMLAFYESDNVDREFSDTNKDTPRYDPSRPATPAPTSFRAPPASPVR